MPRPALETARKLAALAHMQGGYFTAKQAQSVGYTYPQLVYQVSSGNFERVEHGLYRLVTSRPAEHDELIRLSFWSRNQKDEPQAVVSHESALVLHELSELLPREIHLTVPPKFRKAPPKGVVLHKAVFEPGDVEERLGFRVTTPSRTLIDAAKGGVSLEQLGKSVKDALARGLVRKKPLEEAARKIERLAVVLGGKKSRR